MKPIFTFTAATFNHMMEIAERLRKGETTRADELKRVILTNMEKSYVQSTHLGLVAQRKYKGKPFFNGEVAKEVYQMMNFPANLNDNHWTDFYILISKPRNANLATWTPRMIIIMIILPNSRWL